MPPSLALAQVMGNQAFGSMARSARTESLTERVAERQRCGTGPAPGDSTLARSLAQAARDRGSDARSVGGAVDDASELVDGRSLGGDLASDEELVDGRDGATLMRNGTDGGTAVVPTTDGGSGSGGGGGGGGGSGGGGGGMVMGPTVTLPTNVRFPGTPTGMADRIPPRKDFAVAVAVTGWTPPMLPVTVTVEGSGGPNGTATIDGAASADLVASGTVQLRGTVQTTAGSGGNLRIVARQGTTVLASSAMFTIAAIPLDWNDVLLSRLTGARRGIVVQDSWKSDSGVVGDLNETEIAEEVQITTASGCFAGLGGVTSGFLPGHTFSTDTHSTPAAACTSAGVRIAEQTSKFNDRRTGATNVPMPTSGMRITRTVRATAPSGFEIETTKVGASTTANGITSAAGSGTATATQAV